MAEVDYSSMTEIEFCQLMVAKIRAAIAEQSGFSSAKIGTASGAASEYVNWKPHELRAELDVWEKKLKGAEEKATATSVAPRIMVLTYERPD